MSDELKRCPHCGNSDRLIVKRVEGETVSPDNFQVVCSWLSGGCGASGGVRRTEAEAIAAWNTRAETNVTESETNGITRETNGIGQTVDSGEPDSREKLEADICECINARSWGMNHDYMISCLVKWLDRQAAITRDEVFEDGEFDCLTCDAKVELRVEIDRLTAERDELSNAVDKLRRRVDGMFCLNDLFDKDNAKLEAERDSLRKQLAEKQHVCDVQRDSFLKMERELAEANERIGELERTIENMRGD